MGLFRTVIAGKVKQIQAEQHWQGEMAAVVRPMQIKARAAAQILEVNAVLEQDKKLKAVFDNLRLTNPPE